MNTTVFFRLKSSFLSVMLIAYLFITQIPTLQAQNKILEQKFTLDVKEEKLENLLDFISDEIKVFFSYNAELISENQRFTIKAQNEALYLILDKLLLGTSLSYKTIKKQVVIYKKIKNQLNPKEKLSLFGTIRNADTDKPITGVNVFISGSLKGNSSDKFGNFFIEGLFPDIYEVVFSHVGYDIRLLKINAKHEKPTSFSVTLIPKTIQLEEVEVKAEKIKDWNRHFYLFESEFLGNTLNAAKCNILNSEVIAFDYNKSTNTLTAHSTQPLEIENYALGYDIQYYLQSFENNDNKSTIHGVLSFRERVPESRKELRNWKKNRRKSYKGSYSHFLKSLYHNRLKKDGFEIFLVDAINKKSAVQITAEDILFDRSKGFQTKMKFGQYLKINFSKIEFMTSNEIIKEYYRTGNTVQNGIQTSYLKLNLPYVTVLESGQLKERFAVTKYGFWSWERVAEYLPFEYKP